MKTLLLTLILLATGQAYASEDLTEDNIKAIDKFVCSKKKQSQNYSVSQWQNTIRKTKRKIQEAETKIEVIEYIADMNSDLTFFQELLRELRVYYSPKVLNKLSRLDTDEIIYEYEKSIEDKKTFSIHLKYYERRLQKLMSNCD